MGVGQPEDLATIIATSISRVMFDVPYALGDTAPARSCTTRDRWYYWYYLGDAQYAFHTVAGAGMGWCSFYFVILFSRDIHSASMSAVVIHAAG